MVPPYRIVRELKAAASAVKYSSMRTVGYLIFFETTIELPLTFSMRTFGEMETFVAIS
jgi:hypothetical protein